MKKIRVKTNFKVWKKGRKWIQCFVNFEEKGEKKSLQAKVLITPEISGYAAGEWVNNLPVEIQISEDSWTGKQKVEVYPIVIDNSSYVFHMGKYKFENIVSVEEKDLNYLAYLSGCDLSGEVKAAVDAVMENYITRTAYESYEFWAAGTARDTYASHQAEEIEGYEVVSSSYDDDGEFVGIKYIYKKVN